MCFYYVQIVLVQIVKLIQIVLGAVTNADVEGFAALKTTSHFIVQLELDIWQNKVFYCLVFIEVCHAAQANCKVKFVALLFHLSTFLEVVVESKLIELSKLRQV